jgi:glycosyltransferase involved in cell wall biosynthesis
MTDRTVLEARVVTGQGGGPDKTILNSPRFMASRGYPSVCVYLRSPSDSGFAALEEKARRWNAPLEAVDDHGPLDFRILNRLRDVYDRHRPAIWHGHDYKTNLFGLLLARSRPLTLVTTLHGWVKRTWKTPLYYAIDRRCIKRYAAVVAVSQDLFDAALECGTPPDRCFLVPNAIDLDEFKRSISVDEANAKRGVDPKRFVIGAAGRLSPEKGLDLLVHAVADLVANGISAELHIAGDGDDRGRLERIIRERGVQDRVKLVGFQADLADFYQSLDLFALSSLREGLPNVILEAMAFGVPVVATNVAGMPSIIADGKTGLLVPVGSKEALANAIKVMLTETALRNRVAAEGRSLLEREFSFARRMDRMKEIFDLTLDREGRR